MGLGVGTRAFGLKRGHRRVPGKPVVGSVDLLGREVKRGPERFREVQRTDRWGGGWGSEGFNRHFFEENTTTDKELEEQVAEKTVSHLF